MNFKELFNSPKVIAVIGDINEAKSNLLYHLIEELKKEGIFTLYTYGLKKEVPEAITIHSIEELEQVRNSIVVLDEIMSLWNLDDKMARRKIEKSLRLIFHNNNILVICAVPENIRKFIAGKINIYFFKKVTISDFINGSRAKKVITNYKGSEVGSSVLNLKKEEAILFDGLHYTKLKIPYYEKYDSKKNNEDIIKKVNEKVNENKENIK